MFIFNPLSTIDEDLSNEVKHEYRKKLIEAAKVKAKKGFLSLGYGMVAYFSFYEWMIVLLTLMTLLSIPSMWAFSHSSENQFQDQRKYFLSYYNLGNFGFSGGLCRSTALGIGKVQMSCVAGTLRKIADFGIIPDNAKVLDACMQNPETSQCSSRINRTLAESHIRRHCMGKKSCSIDSSSFLPKLRGGDPCLNSDSRFFVQLLCL